MREGAAQRERAQRAERYTDRRQAQSIEEDGAQNLRRQRAEREADPDFARALGDAEGDDAKDADSREQQGYARKCSDEREQRSL